MRLLRVLAIATGFAALISQSSVAQDGRQFRDAWFWGVKAGVTSFTSASTTNGGAPLIGGEWLITRTQGGLYMSLDQAFFTTQGGFLDRAPDSTFTHLVRLENMRRFTVAGMAFPMESAKFHPYAGLGLIFNQIAGATLLNSSPTDARYGIALDSVQAKKTAFSPVILAGVQARYTRYSLFAQGSLSPIQQAFFLSNPLTSKGVTYSVEFGLRYNVGSSIDRAR